MRVTKSGNRVEILLDNYEFCEYGIYLMCGSRQSKLMTSLLRAVCPEFLQTSSSVSAEFKAAGDGCEILLEFKEKIKVRPLKKPRAPLVFQTADGESALRFAKELCLMNAADGCEMYADENEFYFVSPSPSFRLRHIAKELFLHPVKRSEIGKVFTASQKISENIASDLGILFKKPLKSGKTA